jgi:hypothetical protein
MSSCCHHILSVNSINCAVEGFWRWRLAMSVAASHIADSAHVVRGSPTEVRRRPITTLLCPARIRTQLCTARLVLAFPNPTHRLDGLVKITVITS